MLAKQKPPFALDADGVIFDCDLSFREVGSALLGRPLKQLNSKYDLSQRYEISNEEVEHIFEAMMDHEYGWRGMPLMPMAKEGFFLLQEYYDIHIVTAIPEHVKPLRQESFELHGLNPVAIHCAGHHAASKTDILRAISPIGFVDDRLKHLYENDFIEHRVWIDHGDEQDGLIGDDTLYQAKSLHQWVAQWMNTQIHSKTPNIKKSHPPHL